MDNKTIQSIISNISHNEPIDGININGIIHCPKCGKPKQTLVHFPWFAENDKILMPCMCDCDIEIYNKRDEELKEKERLVKLKKLQQAAFMEPAYLKMTFEKDDSPTGTQSILSHRFISHFDEMKENGWGMIFHGSPGNGKTFYAACIANELLLKGKSVWMIKFPTLIAQMQRDRFKVDFSQLINSYDLFILDDFGIERNTEYAQEQLFNIIDNRYSAQKPTIVTTNLSVEQLQSPLNINQARIYGRLLERCVPVEFSNYDRRKSGNCYNEILKILNT